MATPTTLRLDPSIRAEGSVSLPPPARSFSVAVRNSLHSKSMHAIYRGTLCQGEQMYKINIRAVCARRRAMIPESHKSGQWVPRGVAAPTPRRHLEHGARENFHEFVTKFSGCATDGSIDTETEYATKRGVLSSLPAHGVD